VFEIWGEDERKVLFISPEFGDMPIAVQDDPLGLAEFFPIPRPM
jgi:hypothetical protein